MQLSKCQQKFSKKYNTITAKPLSLALFLIYMFIGNAGGDWVTLKVTDTGRARNYMKRVIMQIPPANRIAAIICCFSFSPP
jgi:hypothetical protein